MAKRTTLSNSSSTITEGKTTRELYSLPGLIKQTAPGLQNMSCHSPYNQSTNS